MSDILTPQGLEANETLADDNAMEVYQSDSGGLRRNKQAYLSAFRTFFQKLTSFTATNLVESSATGALRTTSISTSSVSSAISRSNTNETNIDALETRVNDAELDIISNDDDITSLETRMDTAESDIDNLETRIDTAESDIDSLETRMDTAESDIDSNTTAIEGNATAISSLEGNSDQELNTDSDVEFNSVTTEDDVDVGGSVVAVGEGSFRAGLFVGRINNDSISGNTIYNYIVDSGRLTGINKLASGVIVTSTQRIIVSSYLVSTSSVTFFGMGLESSTTGSDDDVETVTFADGDSTTYKLSISF